MLTKKRQLFPGLAPTSPSLFALPLLQQAEWFDPPAPAALSLSRFGNINPIPFRVTIA
jgi:hypothetical protein